MHHQAGLMSGSWDGFDKIRCEIRTYTSDQGDENDVVDSMLLYESEGKVDIELARSRLRIRASMDEQIALAFFFRGVWQSRTSYI